MKKLNGSWHKSNMNIEELNRFYSVDGSNTLRVLYPLDKSSQVFDLGGYRGDWTAQINDRYGCEIHVFEPITELYENIKERFKENSNVKVFNFGLSDKNEKLQITLANDGSSFYTNGPLKVDARVVSIADYLKENNILNVDLIKINIEGDEYPLLELLLATGLISIFDNLQIQFHANIHDAVNKRNSIRERLAETHYLTYDYEFVWENWKRK